MLSAIARNVAGVTGDVACRVRSATDLALRAATLLDDSLRNGLTAEAGLLLASA